MQNSFVMRVCLYKRICLFYHLSLYMRPNENRRIKPSGPQRLHRKELAMGVLYLFSDVFEGSSAESILDVSIPIAQVRSHLRERFGVEYSSNQWIFTQLRRYEEEVGATLFKKTAARSSNEFHVALNPNMVEFAQKQHLHVPQKIKVAAGAYDKITMSITDAMRDRPVRVFLGAGSTVYHLSQIFADRTGPEVPRFQLFTHNAGSIQMLLSGDVDFERLSVVVIGGTLDPVTRTILGSGPAALPEHAYDFIVQGTSCVHDGRLYIESEPERALKSAILHQCTGCKILVVTKHEFSAHALPGVESYGAITDYDYVIVPRSIHDRPQKKYEREFAAYEHLFEPEILNWNYSILKLKR